MCYLQTTPICLLAIALADVPLSAKEYQYKPADSNFYLRAAVLKVEPSAVIVPSGDYQQKGDSYLISRRGKPAHDVYITTTREWLEPVTPPSMPDSLGVAPDVMQIREPQGDVQVADPSAPANFIPALDGMPIANGATVRTGANGTAAVLFGGIDSVRLTPSSEAVVQQTVTSDLRSTRVDLHSGVAFSKVGLRPGEKQDYQVHTPHGVASAKGTDFVCVALPDRTDVWVAQGVVQLDQATGQPVGTVRSDGKGMLKLIRFPLIEDAQQALEATSATMTSALNFIPTVNLKVKTLHDQAAQGVKLTSREEKYLSLIKQVPCLLKLTLVEPPPPIAMPKPELAAPSVHPAMTPRLDVSSSITMPPPASTNAMLAPIATGKDDTVP